MISVNFFFAATKDDGGVFEAGTVKHSKKFGNMWNSFWFTSKPLKFGVTKINISKKKKIKKIKRSD